MACLQCVVRVGGDDPSQLDKKDEASGSGGGVKINPPPAEDRSNNDNGESYASATLKEMVRDEGAKWAEVIRAAGIKPE